MGKADKEFGSQADLVQNEAGMGSMGSIAEDLNKDVFTRAESKRSEFETVSLKEHLISNNPHFKYYSKPLRESAPWHTIFADKFTLSNFFVSFQLL